MKDKKVMSKPPSLQDVKTGIELSKAYRGIFPEIFKIIVLPINSVCYYWPICHRYIMHFC